MKMKMISTTIHGILSDPRVYQIQRDHQTWYSVAGVLEVLTESEDVKSLWEQMTQREPALAALSQPMPLASGDSAEKPRTFEAMTFDGVMRLVQSVQSPRAERVKRWLVETARQRLEEAENPELAMLRARRLYEHRGYSRRWIDKRLRGVSARHELTSEWHRRGANEGEDYRALTNDLMKAAFGKDVEEYRRHKGLSFTAQNLRDHMTDLELALTSLAETTAAVLHRDRQSDGVQQLKTDVVDAGHIVSETISRIESQGGHTVVYPEQPASCPVLGMSADAA
jgi:hypothetical protein